MARKGEIVRRGGKDILITDDKGSGRVVTSRDRARKQAAVRIKRDTASGAAPPIPQPVGRLPTTQKELNAARAARKKKKVKPPVSATENEPTKRGLRKAIDEAAEGRKKAEEAVQQRKK